MGCSAEKAIEVLSADIGQVVKVMKDKNEEDKEDLVSKICEELGYSQESEVFKFLGLI